LQACTLELDVSWTHSDALDGLHMNFRYKGKTIGQIKTTRASYVSLGYDEAVRGVTDENDKRKIQRKLLSQLPKGAVEIDRKYRP